MTGGRPLPRGGVPTVIDAVAEQLAKEGRRAVAVVDTRNPALLRALEGQPKPSPLPTKCAHEGCSGAPIHEFGFELYFAEKSGGAITRWRKPIEAWADGLGLCDEHGRKLTASDLLTTAKWAELVRSFVTTGKRPPLRHLTKLKLRPLSALVRELPSLIVPVVR